VSDRETAKAHWSIQLDFECPGCGDPFDYFDTDDFCSEDGGRGLPDVAKAGQKEITCDCGAEITLDIQGGW